MIQRQLPVLSISVVSVLTWYSRSSHTPYVRKILAQRIHARQRVYIYILIVFTGHGCRHTNALHCCYVGAVARAVSQNYYNMLGIG